MKLPRSLQWRITVGSLSIFLILYAAAFALVLGFEQRINRSELQLVLYAEAESLAGDCMVSGRLDIPELDPVEPAESGLQIPLWLRIVQGKRVLAASPGMPVLPVRAPRGSRGKLEILQRPDGSPIGCVRHPIGNHPGTWAEALAPLDHLDRQRRHLMLALGLAGLLLIPAAALGNAWVARQALRPVDDLVRSIRGLDSQRLEERLAAPGAVAEIAQLTEEFNLLLARLEQSVATMVRFTADASHELRTPLSILRVGLEVALRKTRSAEEYREVLGENLAEIQRIQRTVEGLLTLARAQHTGHRAIPATPVDLSAVIETALRQIRAVAEERGVTLAAALQPGVLVRGDADQLRLMALNLLDNALAHTPAGQTVHVELSRGGDGVRLAVRDEGPGIDPADRPHLFDRFFRGPGKPGAGGLGLSVVRWVAESHGGSVGVRESPEPGATFEVLLPSDPLLQQQAEEIGGGHHADHLLLPRHQ